MCQNIALWDKRSLYIDNISILNLIFEESIERIDNFLCIDAGESKNNMFEVYIFWKRFVFLDDNVVGFIC